MEQYIPKSALVAEIERRLHFDNNWIEGDKRRQIHTNGVSSVYYRMIGSKHACERILDFIDTLEVKDVDLEKEFNNFLDNVEGMPRIWYSDEQIEWGKNIARHFYGLGLKEQKGE